MRTAPHVKNAADIVTLLRIPLAAALLLTPPFGAWFWACYIGAGASDVLDGLIARALKQSNDFGAKLDSAADAVFACAIAAVIVINVPLPAWLWVSAGLIALLRLAGYAVGYVKYRAFFALHTYANKLTGALLFAFPLLYMALGTELGGAILCAVAAVSAAEEFVITLGSERPDRDCRGIFIR